MSQEHPPPGGPYPAPGEQPTQPHPAGAAGTPTYPTWTPAPPPPPAGWGTPPPSGWGPPAAMAAHKPGAIPLRPLRLGDMYDAAFRIIRFNPKATVGSAVLVAAVAMAIPLVVTAVLTALFDVSLVGSFVSDTDGTAEIDTENAYALGGMVGSYLLGSLLQGIGLILVGGMIAHVVAAAAIGRRLSLGDAWAATRGARWRLIGLTLLLGLLTTVVMTAYVLTWIPVVMLSDHWAVPTIYGIVSVPLFIAFMVWFWVRIYYLPVPALMLERTGVVGAMRRGYGLTRGAFWRTLGIGLLTMIIAQVAGSMLSMPISLVSQGVLFAAPGEAGAVLMMVGQALVSVISAAFVAPFTTAVTCLQYIDLRMRKEAYDVELMQQAGITRA